MKLTDLKCRTATRENDGSKLWDGGGLYLELHKNGRKYWRYKYRIHGKERLLSIGVYPEVPLVEARQRHKEAHKLVAAGTDPSLHKLEQQAARKLSAANTFEVVAREWINHKRSEWTPKYATTITNRLEVDIFPQIGKLPIDSIKLPTLLDMLREIEARGVYELSRRANQYCSQIFRYAVQTGRAARDITVDLRGALKTKKVEHHAAIDSKELPKLIHALKRNDARMYHPTRLAVELMMLTFVRTTELITMRWDEIDWEDKVWVIPAEKMKMKRAHVVPLSKQSIALLEELKAINGTREWVFASHTRPRQPMSNNAILAALYRMGYKGQMTGHGFRALALTTLQEKLGYPFEVADVQLAHAKKHSLGEAYDRAQFLDKRKVMMQDWANYLDGLTGVDKVISMHEFKETHNASRNKSETLSKR